MPRSLRMDCGSIGRPTSPRCAHTTPERSSGECGRGRFPSSSDTLPTTHSTMPGRWRTRISPPRTDLHEGESCRTGMRIWAS
jgi:hypothetical protein